MSLHIYVPLGWHIVEDKLKLDQLKANRFCKLHVHTIEAKLIFDRWVSELQQLVVCENTTEVFVRLVKTSVRVH